MSSGGVQLGELQKGDYLRSRLLEWKARPKFLRQVVKVRLRAVACLLLGQQVFFRCGVMKTVVGVCSATGDINDLIAE